MLLGRKMAKSPPALRAAFLEGYFWAALSLRSRATTDQVRSMYSLNRFTKSRRIIVVILHAENRIGMTIVVFGAIRESEFVIESLKQAAVGKIKKLSAGGVSEFRKAAARRSFLCAVTLSSMPALTTGSGDAAVCCGALVANGTKANIRNVRSKINLCPD